MCAPKSREEKVTESNEGKDKLDPRSQPTRLSPFFAGETTEAMEIIDDDEWMEVPERNIEDLEIRVPVVAERTGDATRSWADVVEESSASNNAEAVRPVYPAHLLSEVNSFDGTLPQQRLSELSHSEQLRLFRLNGVPNRPCSARFRLLDN